jgi:hypothetical protein
MIRYSNAGAQEEKPELASDKSSNQRQNSMSLSADLATTEPKPLPFDSSQTSSPKTHSKRIRFSKVTRKVPILERHIRRAKISVGQRRARSSRKTFPSNKRLLATSRARETKSAQAKENVSRPHPTSPPLLSSQKDKTH